MKVDCNYSLETNNQNSIFEQQNNWIEQRKSGFGVDKTMIIKWVIDNPNKKIVVTRPRHWGKRYNMDIIKSFFEFPIQTFMNRTQDTLSLNRLFYLGTILSQRISQSKNGFHQMDNPNYIIFEIQKQSQNDKFSKDDHLEPAKFAQYWDDYQHHFANYIVIRLDFNWYDYENYLRQQGRFKYLYLKYLYEQHEYLRLSSWKETYNYHYNQFGFYNDSERQQRIIEMFDEYLTALLQMLHQFHQKQVILLVYEYDHLCQILAIKHQKEPNQYPPEIDAAIALNNILDCFYRHDFVFKVICMGVRNIVTTDGFLSNREDIDSIENNSEETAELFGFTKEEIWEQLILKIFKHQTEYQKQACHKLMQQIQRTYGGQYAFFNQQSKTIFTPLYVLYHLDQCKKRKQVVALERIQSIFYRNLPRPSTGILSAYLQLFHQFSNTICSILFQLISDYLSGAQSSIRLSEQLKQVRTDEILRKRIAEYTFQEMIYHLICCGYLTNRGGFVAITTRHLCLLLKNILSDILQECLKNIATMLQLSYSMSRVQNWSVCQPSIEKLMNAFCRQFKQFRKQFLAQVFAFVISRTDLRTFRGWGTVDFETKSDYYLSVEGKLIIQNHRVIVSYQFEPDKLQEVIDEEFQFALFRILQNNWINFLLYNEKYKFPSQKPTVILRSVVGVYGYQRLFKTYIREKKIEFKAESLAYASGILFSKRKQIKDIGQIRIHCFNKRVMSSQQFINCVIGHFERSIYDQNRQILDEAEILWKRESYIKQSRQVRNMRTTLNFSMIKDHLQLRFFGFRRLRDAMLTAEDFQGLKQNEMIEPLSVLANEVQHYLDSAQQMLNEKQGFEQNLYGKLNEPLQNDEDYSSEWSN